MQKIFPSLILVIILSSASCAQKSSSLLWKVTAPNGEESYLFGTYHLAGPEYLNDHPKVKEVFEQSKKVVVETQIDSSKLGMVAQMGMMMNHSIWDFYDTAEYELVDRVLQQKLGMGLTVLGRFKPVIISTLYATTVAHEVMDDAQLIAESVPIDLYFAAQGKKVGKDLILLETMEEQLDLIYNTQPLEEQASILLEMIQDTSEVKSASAELVQAYVDQDLLKIQELMETGADEFMDSAIMLDDRNKNWIPKLRPILNEGSAFIAVGAGHLPGDIGLLKLLKEEGYETVPIQN